MNDIIGKVSVFFNSTVQFLSLDCLLKWTASLMLSCSLIMTSRQLIGEPISCEATGVSKDVINNFCWVNSTFTLVNDTQLYHNWYQWVCFIFLTQSLLLCIPRFLWNAYEGGKMVMITKNLCDSMLPVSDKKHLQELLTNYFKQNLSRHNTYAIAYLIYEVGNCIMALGQLLFVHWFLGGFSETQNIDNLETVIFTYEIKELETFNGHFLIRCSHWQPTVSSRGHLLLEKCTLLTRCVYFHTTGSIGSPSSLQATSSFTRPSALFCASGIGW